MRYLKPKYYEKFVCTADQCPDTCCAGWQIMIDEESLEKYDQVEGAFGNRLRNSIDWEEGSFYQYDSRCCFLNEENLCDLYKELGKESLCDTCRMYPRHVEEYEGLRELSLSLSCPVAAEMILSYKEKLEFDEEEDEEEDDFEEFDFLMFSQLEDAREVIFSIIQNRNIDFSIRVRAVRKLASEFQKAIEEERSFDIDDLLEAWKTKNQAGDFEEEKNEKEDLWSRRQKEWKVLEGLERLRPEWSKVLKNAKRLLYSWGKTEYEKTCEAFQKAYGAKSEHKEEWEIMSEQLLMFFVYTYFCGSVYDDMVYSKMGLSLFCLEWIWELVMLRWLENGRKLDFSDIVEVSYRLAREIEHSDLNLDAIEEFFCASYE